jgi:hypothetical protein
VRSASLDVEKDLGQFKVRVAKTIHQADLVIGKDSASVGCRFGCHDEQRSRAKCAGVLDELLRCCRVHSVLDFNNKSRTLPTGSEDEVWSSTAFSSWLADHGDARNRS